MNEQEESPRSDRHFLSVYLKDIEMVAGGDLVSDNLLLVVHIEKRFRRRDVPMEDLIQEGNVGLIKAAARYRPERGTFTTYAGYYIEGHISRAIQHMRRFVYMPAYTHGVLRSLRDGTPMPKRLIGAETMQLLRWYAQYEPVVHFDIEERVM